MNDDATRRTTDEPRTDVAVIGAGLAGLAAAIEAARAGRRVAVLDARRTIGGRARTRVVRGFQLNEGAHALSVGGEAMAFLRELGREPAGGVPDATSGVGVDGDVVGVLPVGVGSLIRTPLIRGERLRFARMSTRLRSTDPEDLDGTTVDEMIDTLSGRGRAGRVTEALVRLSTYGNDPSHASAGAFLRQLRIGLEHGVRYVHGGWQKIVDSLEEEARMAGVEIVRGAKVTKVVATHGAVEVHADRCRPAGAVVIAAGGPRSVDRLLDGASAIAARWAHEARPSTVASLDVGLRGSWGEGPRFALGIDRPTYLSVHAPVADLAPDGDTLVSVMRYHHPDEAPDAEADRIECETILDRVRPGWRDAAAHTEFRPRMTAVHDQPRAERGGLPGRPGPAVGDVGAVFVAGDWVGPVGVLSDAAVASGRAAGRAAAGFSRRTGTPAGLPGVGVGVS